MTKRLGCLTAALLCLVGLESARAGFAPKDDFLIAVQDTARPISPAELMANDGAMTPGTGASIVVITQPQHGTLVPDGSGGHVYRSAPGYYGKDSFRYALKDGPQLTPSAIVYLNVAPDYVAYRGNFNGDAFRDWGWFESASGRFNVCIGPPDQPASCRVVLRVPSLAGRTPVIGDWDGDGLDDVGLYDSATGWFHLLSLRGSPQKSFQLGSGGFAEKPLAGDWNADGLDSVGLYVPATGRVALKNRNTSAGAMDYQFLPGAEWRNAAPTTAIRPAAGDGVALQSGQMVLVIWPRTGERLTRETLCDARPEERPPIEYSDSRGLIVYDFGKDAAKYCDRVQMPIDVYLPPE